MSKVEWKEPRDEAWFNAFVEACGGPSCGMVVPIAPGGVADFVRDMRAENARLRSALEFYADEENYESRPVVEGGAFKTLYPEVEMDKGERARAALGGE